MDDSILIIKITTKQNFLYFITVIMKTKHKFLQVNFISQSFQKFGLKISINTSPAFSVWTTKFLPTCIFKNVTLLSVLVALIGFLLLCVTEFSRE